MKINKNKLKKNLNFFYKSYFYITITIFFVLYLAFLNTGIWKNFKKDFYKRIHLNGISNYQFLPEISFLVLRNIFFQLDTFDLEIDLNNILIIENNRKQKLQNSNIKFIEAEAYILDEDQKIKTNIRLKGDRKIHYEDQKKSSYKLNIANSKSYKSLSSFSIQKPRVRNYVHEWVFHKMAKEIGLINLHYEFVNLKINNQKKGLFVIEEGFSNNLLKKNDKKKGPIFGLNEDFEMNNFFESKFDVYQLNHWSKKKNKNLYLEAKNKLTLMQSKNFELNKIIDIKLWADYFVLCDLLFTYHGALPKSVKFYFNPTTKLFEPIPFDGHKLPGYDYSPIIEDIFSHDLIFDLANRNNFKDDHEKNFTEWLRLFFYKQNGDLNQEFYLSYQKSIKRIINDEFIKDFLKKNKKKINRINAKIYLDDFQIDQNSKIKSGLGIYYFNYDKIIERSKKINKKNILNLDKIVVDDYEDRIVIKNKDYNNIRLKIKKILCKNINSKTGYVYKNIDYQIKINKNELYKNEVNISKNICKKILLIDIINNIEYSKKIDQNFYSG